MTAYDEPKNDWAAPDVGDYAEFNKVGDSVRHLYENHTFGGGVGGGDYNTVAFTMGAGVSQLLTAHPMFIPDGYRVVLRTIGFFNPDNTSETRPEIYIVDAGAGSYTEYELTPVITLNGATYAVPNHVFGANTSGGDLTAYAGVQLNNVGGTVRNVECGLRYTLTVGIEEV